MVQIRVPPVLSLVLATVFSSLAIAHPPAPEQEPRQVTIRGQIVSLDSAGRRVRPDDKRQAQHFGFDGADGRFYSFLADDLMTAMFADQRVRERQLQITAQLHKENKLEVIKVQAIRGGKLYDLYYFCELCNITTYAPGPCPCCREELEFRETPTPEP